MIIDSGERVEFDSGAVRDIKYGKGRCDLLPLDVMYYLFDIKELDYINKYIESGDISYIRAAVSLFISRKESGYSDKSLSEIILDLSHHYEEGAKKYGEDNWKKGIPIKSFLDSGVRHLLKCLSGYDDESHNRAFLWNMTSLIWTHNSTTKSPFDEG